MFQTALPEANEYLRVLLTSARPLGTASVTFTPVAAPAPVLVTVIV